MKIIGVGSSNVIVPFFKNIRIKQKFIVVKCRLYNQSAKDEIELSEKFSVI